MAKLLKTLVKELEFKTYEQYFDYILETLINGQKQQVRELFNEMRKEDQKMYLNEYLGYTPKENELRSICIEELTI